MKRPAVGFPCLILLMLTLASLGTVGAIHPIETNEAPPEASSVVPEPDAVTSPETLEHLVGAQPSNLEAAQRILSIRDGAFDSDLHKAVALAKEGTRWQASTLGLDWDEPIPLEGHRQPSAALLRLSARYDVVPDPSQLEQIHRFNSLDEPLRTSLARFIDAFLALDTAARLAYQDVDAAIIDEFIENNSSQQETPGAGELLKDAGIDLTPVFPARNQFLDTVVDLHTMLNAHPVPFSQSCQEAAVAPLFSISLGDCDDTYRQDLALLLDTGGNNRYYNNAGGAGAELQITCRLANLQPAAALADLGDGNNEYGDPEGLRRCGENGGGAFGAGFLLDLGGHDTYTASNDGTNGGGFFGTGYLFDLDGNDIYIAGDRGTNGGGFGGIASLIDTRGTDHYEDSAIPGGSCWDCTLIPKDLLGVQLDEDLPVSVPLIEADAGCRPLPPDLEAPVTCHAWIEVNGDRIADEEHSFAVEVESVAKVSDIGIAEAPDATLTIEQGLLRISVLGFPIDQTLVTPRIDGEPDPSNLDQDLGPISTTYTHVQDLCIDDACAFIIGAELGDDVKVGELWEAELRIFLDGATIAFLPFTEVRLDP